jgi:WD40 repeat protein
MACLGNDKKLARKLLPRLDAATYWTTIWQANGRLEYYKRKFMPEDYADEISRTLCTRLGWVTSVSYLKDGGILAAGELPHVEFWRVGDDKPNDVNVVADAVGKMAVDARGKRMVACHGIGGGAGPIAVVYDVEDVVQPKVLRGHTGAVVRVAISPDGRLFGTASSDHTARIWKLSDITKPIVLKHPEPVYDIAFSPDNKTVATTSDKGGLWLWDAATGNALGDAIVNANQGPWYCKVCFLPKSNQLVTAANDETVRRWDLNTRKCAQANPSGGMIFSLAISPDEKWIALGREAGRVDLLETETLNTKFSYKEQIAQCESVAFSPDGRSLASASIDGTIKVWPVPDFGPPKQAADGTIRLEAFQAQINGSHLFAEGVNHRNLGAWNDTSEYPSWTVDVEKAGTFTPEVTYAVPYDCDGSIVELSAGEKADEKSSVKLIGTESFTDYRPLAMPPLQLKPGKQTLAFKALTKPGGAVMNLRCIVLRPHK